jgi:multidrug efflux pump
VTAARLDYTAIFNSTIQRRQLGSIIYTQLNQYYVVLEVAPQYWQRPQGLKFIYLRTSTNGVVPLDAVTQAQTGTTPLTVNHTGLFPSVTVSFNLAPGTSLSDAAEAITGMQQNLGTPTIRGSSPAPCSPTSSRWAASPTSS